MNGLNKIKWKVLLNIRKIITHHLHSRFKRYLVCDKVGWLIVNQLVVIFKIKRNREPEYLAEKLVLETPTGRIINKKFGLTQKDFVIHTSSNWNNLPMQIRNLVNIGSFKVEVEKWITKNIPRFID